jgi:DNA-binding NarL/FixJ family response regulator
MIRLLIVDDSAVFRNGLQSLLRTVPDFEVCGVAGDGAAGADAAVALHADVVLMDIAMPGISGIDATRRIAASAPHIGVVVMTMLEDDDAITQALKAGARGYLVKGATQHEITDTIRSVHAGHAIIGRTVARQLAGLIGAMAPQEPFPDLTPREREVLALLASGATTQQIADRLDLTSKTVRNHLSNILTKLQAVDRAQAILIARDAGLR